MSMALVAKSQVDMFGFDNFRLLCLLVKDGIFQRFSLIEDFDIVFSIQTNSDSCMLHGVGGTFGLDLEDDFLELNSQVLG